jgi:hypothetical protein
MACFFLVVYVNHVFSSIFCYLRVLEYLNNNWLVDLNSIAGIYQKNLPVLFYILTWDY